MPATDLICGAALLLVEQSQVIKILSKLFLSILLQFSSKYNLCIVLVLGIADSIRKAVAREMASVQFLQQIREVYKDCRIPNYEVFDELFIDPRIVRALEKEVGERCLNMSDEVRVRPMKSCDGQGNRRIHYYLFVCSYYVGTETFKGKK